MFLWVSFVGKQVDSLAEGFQQHVFFGEKRINPRNPGGTV